MQRAVFAAVLALGLGFGLLAIVDAEVVVYREDSPLLVTIEQEFRDLPANFGPEIYDGIRGLLVVGEPENGCGNMTAPPSPQNVTADKWIVLVGRFNCSFEKKVRYAMAAGYDCVIVHNVGSDELETMSAKDPNNIDIPSVFVSGEAGEALMKYTYKDGPYYIMVNGDLPFNINTHLLLPFAVVVALCLIVIIIFMIVKCIKDRARARRHRLPNRSLRKIPTCKFSKGDPYDTCAICLDDYQEGERLRVLPCAHAYHSKCIDPWLTQNRRVCPVCKRKVLAAGERERRSDSDSDSDAPLLRASTPRATQGGTFLPQSVNPFAHAERIIANLRAADVEQHAATTEADENEGSSTADTAPLLPAVAAVSERRSRRRRRARSASAAAAPAQGAQASRGAPGRQGSQGPQAPGVPEASDAGDDSPGPAPASDRHSINTESRGEIGVAALPALPHSSSTPHHLDL